MKLFFALWPDAAAAEALARLAIEVAQRAQGKPVPREKIHLTLSFLGEVPEARMQEARSAAAGSLTAPFDMAFDTIGSFRKARVAWTGCADPAPGLVGLQSRLEERLHDRGFALEDRPYVPHITLARKAGRPLPRSSASAIGWNARELALVRSETGTGRYTTIETWELER